MTEEVVVAAEAALAGRYAEVIVADGHGNAHNIDPDCLPDNVRLVRSWPRPLLQMQGVESDDIDACAFIGYHASSASQNSILAHAYYGLAYRAVRLNGELCTEGYLNAAVAGELDRPVMFVSGDVQTIEDAQRYAPAAVGFVTKQSIGRRSQMSLPPAQVRRELREAFRTALDRPLGEPFRLSGPFRLELEMTTQVAAEILAFLPIVERTGPFGVAVTFDRIDAVMRFVSFAMTYSPDGVLPPALA